MSRTSSSYLRGHGTRETVQSEPMREDQIKNQAGGFVWSVGPWEQLRRWLILGSEGGTYFASEKDQTKQNVNALRECLRLDGRKAVQEIVEISKSGRAPKNELAIFALAYAAGNGDEVTQAHALEAIPLVCRTGTHLFQFVEYVQQHRGWGPALKKAVARWYTDPHEKETIADKADLDARHINWLAYQLVKYRQRGGWTHRDVLRLAKPKPERGSEVDQLLAWTVGKFTTVSDLDADVPRVIRGFEKAQQPGVDIAGLVQQYELPREALPSEALADPNVWEALLDAGMPMTALIRNLANMTRVGLLTPTSNATQKVIAQIGGAEGIHKARVHPIQVLIAQRTYASGHGLRGTNTWDPIVQIVDALDDAFYLAFDNVEPTNLRYMLALDISPSMGGGEINGIPGLTPRMGAAAMSLVTAKTERSYEGVAFAGGGRSSYYSGPETDMSGIQSFPLSPKQRLNDAMNEAEKISRSYSRTDCALPMLYALDREREVDVFQIYTDNETWSGGVHPAQALQQYRDKSGINAKLIVIGMTATESSIADPKDAGMLDVVGFDAAAPTIMAEFAVGRV